MTSDSAAVLCIEADNCIVEAQQTKENGAILAKAATLYLKASSLDKHLAAPYLGLSLIAYSMGDQKQAVGLLMQAQSLEPYNLKVVKMMRRFKKKAPPAPPPKSTKIGAIRPTDFSEKVSFKPDSEHAARKKRIRSRLGLQKGCLQDQEQIMLLQSALQAIGLPLDVNGTFDKKTLKAVQKYQYKLKLPVTGVTDKKLTQHLNRILDKLDDDPLYFEKQRQKKSKEAPSTETESTENVEPNPTKLTSDLGAINLKGKVHSGPEVQLLQETLTALGFSLEVTWDYDLQTSKAVRAFQTQYKLPLTGWVDAKSREVLNPLIEVSIRQKDLLDELLQAIYGYWETQGLSSERFWKSLARNALKQVFQVCETAQEEPLAPPEILEKPIIEQPIGSKGQAGTLSEGPLLSRLQTLFMQEGIELNPTGLFDLQTIGALRTYLKKQDLPTSDAIGPELWQHFNAAFENIYVKERIRDTLNAQFLMWCQFREVPWQEAIQNTLLGKVFLILEQDKLPQIKQDLGPAGRYGKISKGIDVGILQYLLNKLEYTCTQNRIFDLETQKALRAFQSEKGLPPTGIAEDRTLETLNSLLHEMNQ